MLFVWITSYLFVLIVGGVLALAILFKFFCAKPGAKVEDWNEPGSSLDVEPLSEPSIPPSGPILA